ncbi:hypothetical protein Tcan_05974 [Toxocara canis]|nr:hypothetical protein Tcan_05974 [Toxocara canis]
MSGEGSSSTNEARDALSPVMREALDALVPELSKAVVTSMKALLESFFEKILATQNEMVERILITQQDAFSKIMRALKSGKSSLSDEALSNAVCEAVEEERRPPDDTESLDGEADFDECVASESAARVLTSTNGRSTPKNEVSSMATDVHDVPHNNSLASNSNIFQTSRKRRRSRSKSLNFFTVKNECGVDDSRRCSDPQRATATAYAHEGSPLSSLLNNYLKRLREEGTADAVKAECSPEWDAMEELRSFNAAKLIEKTSLSDGDFDRWLMRLKLLPSSRICDCGLAMKIKKTKTSKRLWVCKRRACAKSRGFYTDTFFCGSRLPIKTLFKMSYYWCVGTLTLERVEQELGREGGHQPSIYAIVQWNGLFRDVCAGYFLQNPIRLGGEGKKILIEEILIVKEQTRKARRGNERWGFAGTEPNSKACFLEAVEGDLNAESLLPLIERYVLPGTEIVSNLWRKYEIDGQLPEAYIHLASKMSLLYAKPEVGEGRSHIEESWYKFRCDHNKKCDSCAVLSTHLKEFMWRRLFGGEDCMYNFWSQIASTYVFTD